MSNWPLDCKTKANQLLPDHLNFLYNELAFMLGTVTPELQYTELTSRLHHRIGECSILAEIVEDSRIFTLVNTLHSQLKSIYSGINYHGSISDMWEIYYALVEVVQNLRQQSKETQVISVGNYKEEV